MKRDTYIPALYANFQPWRASVVTFAERQILPRVYQPATDEVLITPAQVYEQSHRFCGCSIIVREHVLPYGLEGTQVEAWTRE